MYTIKIYKIYEYIGRQMLKKKERIKNASSAWETLIKLKYQL